MNNSYLYLFLDIITILVPLLFSFYPKAPFYKHWRSILPAIVLPAAIFMLWDELFTRAGIWGFNEKYLTGVYIFNLPLEEIFFFVCIPYACLFTYFALNHIVAKDYLKKYQDTISAGLLPMLIIAGIYHVDKWYTSITFLSLGAFLALQILVKSNYLGRFYFTFLFILIPFFGINGILTGAFIEGEVVWYNNEENLGIRIGTIPVEDVFYGMLLLALNVAIFEHQKKRYTR